MRPHNMDITKPASFLNINDAETVKRILLNIEAQTSHIRRKLERLRESVSVPNPNFEGLDPVTGLSDRAGFYHLFDAQCKRIKANESWGGTLVLADIDNYENIRSVHGQYVLSLCLKQVANILLSDLSYESDTAYIGRGEFVVLIPDQHKEAIIDEAQYLRSKLDRISFQWNDRSVNVKSSIGVHSYNASDRMERLLFEHSSASFKGVKNLRHGGSA